MAKKKVSKKIEKEIKDYIALLKKDNLPIEKIILFGSYAKGTEHKWSDIDLCIISPKFKNSWRALNYLWQKREKNSGLTIEPIGFSPKDFKEEDSLIHEIKRTGIEIKLKQLI